MCHMARKKNFITKAMQNWIIQRYGGGHRYIYDAESTKATGHIEYRSKNNSGCTLTINEYWQDNNIPYIMVHISDNKGYIIRKDRYNFDCKDNKRLWFVETEEGGIYYDTFRKVGGTMARNTKVNKIRTLEERIKVLEEALDFSTKRNREMSDKAEDSFMNSPTYQQMLQQVDFFKNLNKLNDINLANAKKSAKRADDYIRQIYEDNKRLTDEKADTEYFVGITENWHEAKEYNELKAQIVELESKLEQRDISISQRDDEISRLQLVIGESKCTTTAPSVDVSSEDTQEIEELRQENNRLNTELRRQQTLRNNTKFELDRVRRELKQEKNKKYDQYVPEDAMTYNELEKQYSFYKHLCKDQTDYRVALDKRIKELEQQITDLTTTLPLSESVQVIEQNIEQSRELKKVTSPKGGRPNQIKERQIATILELKKNGASMRDIANQMGISVGSVHRIIKMNE